MSLLYFILLIGILIFVHEFGHFIFAKAFGVRVLTFSLGFGPRLWGFHWKGTDYQISALPLGGYVKMLGDELSQDDGVGDQRDSLNSKPVWQRFLIVFAGPLFNLLLPLPVYFFYYIGVDTVAPSVVASLRADGPAAQAGMKPGDRIIQLGDKKIHAWWQVLREVSDNPGKPMKVVVDRDGKATTLPRPVTPAVDSEWISRELNIKREVGRIGIFHSFLKPILAVTDPYSAAARSGLKTFDQVVSLNGKPVKTQFGLFRALRMLKTPYNLTVLREVPLPNSTPVFELFSYKALTIRVKPQSRGDYLKGLEQAATLPGAAAELKDPIQRERLANARYTGDWTLSQGIEDADLVVRYVIAGSAAAKCGLRVGDRILAVNGSRYPRWEWIRSILQREPTKRHVLLVQRMTRQLTLTMMMDAHEFKGELGSKQTMYLFGAYNRSLYTKLDPVANEARWRYAVTSSWRNTSQAISVTVLALLRLFQGRISTKEIGGPLLIYDIAGKTQERGWEYFFQIMVWISVNLALINLLPIPMLDGGQIFFLLVEAIRRKPVSLRFREIASYVGFSILIFLMVFAFKNDIERKWDDIVNFFK